MSAEPTEGLKTDEGEPWTRHWLRFLNPDGLRGRRPVPNSAAWPGKTDFSVRH